MKPRDLFFVFIVILSGVVTTDAFAANKDEVWFRTHEMPVGVAIVAHGLNLKPEKMDSLCRLLQARNIESLRITLSGHEGDMEKFKKATPERWRGDFAAGLKSAAARAKELKVPLYFVGFSLGAVSGLDAVLSASDGKAAANPFAKMVLFAPAISLKPVSHLLKVFGLFGAGFCIPSKNLPEYRVHDCTPLGAYRALDGLRRDLDEKNWSSLDVPTLVIADPSDELVSVSGIRDLIRERGLSKWTVLIVNHDESELPKRINHLVIDEPSLGAKQWALVVDALGQLLHP